MLKRFRLPVICILGSQVLAWILIYAEDFTTVMPLHNALGAWILGCFAFGMLSVLWLISEMVA